MNIIFFELQISITKQLSEMIGKGKITLLEAVGFL